MSTLWLLRHAHPLVDAGVCYGRLDVAADAVRTAQAAHDFSGLLSAGSVLRHSPLCRCVQLADALTGWQREGGDVALLIGGADGLDPALKQRADMLLRLSSLTLPHGMVRVLLAEQLYRAWSITRNHPYHRV